MANGVDAEARELVLSARSFEAGKRAYAKMLGSHERAHGALSSWREWAVTVEGLLPANDSKARAASYSAFCHGWLAAYEAA